MILTEDLLRQIIREALMSYPEWVKNREIDNAIHMRMNGKEKPICRVGDNLIWDRTLHGSSHIGIEALKEVLQQVDFDKQLDDRRMLKQRIFFKEPIAYDELVVTTPNDRIVYAIRGGLRSKPSRFALGREPKKTNVLNITLNYRGETFQRSTGEFLYKWDVITVYGGESARKEPWDPTASLRDAQFWLNHAFTTHTQEISNPANPEEYWGKWGVPRNERQNVPPAAAGPKQFGKVLESVSLNEAQLRKVISEIIQEYLSK